MRIFPLRLRPSRVSRRASEMARRRRAAELVVDEVFGGTPARLDGSPSAKLAGELVSMRSIVETLEQLPGQAWAPEPGAASAAASLTRGLRGRLAPRVGAVPRAGAIPRVGAVLAAGALAAAFVVGSLTHPFSGAAHPSLGAGHPYVGAAHPSGAAHPRVSPLASSAHVVLRPLPGTPAASLAVAYMPGGGSMVLRVRSLPRSAPGTYYELWLMTSDTDLVSVTSFRVGAAGTGSLRLVLPDDPSHYKYLDISVQHVGTGITISQDNVLRGAIPA